MSVADVMGQIGEIQARLALLTPSPTGSADGGSGFASALSGATAADGTTATSTTATSTTAAVGTGAGATGSDVVQAALQYKGVPYVLGGESKSGIDCSGLVQAAYKDVGVSVPRLVHEQRTIGQPVASLKDAQPGDLVVLNGGDHVAIWMGNDTVVHAPYPGRTVSVQKAWFSDKDVVTIRRVLPADATASSGTSAPLAGATAATSAGGVSAATAARAIGMLGEAGSLGGSSSDPSSSGSSGSSLSSLLTTLSAGSGATSGTTAQQLLAARTALLSTEA